MRGDRDKRKGKKNKRKLKGRGGKRVLINDEEIIYVHYMETANKYKGV